MRKEHRARTLRSPRNTRLIYATLLAALCMSFIAFLYFPVSKALASSTVVPSLRVTRGTSQKGRAASIGAGVTVSGSGFRAGETITLSLDKFTLSTTPNHLISAGNGSFSATFVVPPLAIRAYPLIATGQRSGTRASLMFWLQAAIENDYSPLSSNATYQISDPDTLEPQMQYLRITNNGDADLIAPKVLPDSLSNTDPILDTTSLSTIVSGILAAHPEAITNAQKAYVLWQWLTEATYHWNDAQKADNVNQMDVIGIFNNYGYLHCWDHSRFLADMFIQAGYQARTWNLGGHAVTEVNYDNAWHMYDSDLQKMYTSTDGTGTIVSEQSLVNNPNPIYFNTTVDGKSVVTGVGLYTSTFVANLYATSGDNLPLKNVFPPVPHPMGITLRKNETLMENWSNVGKYHDNYLHTTPPVYTDGDIDYVPDLTLASYQNGVFSQTNISSSSQDGIYPNLHSQTAGSSSSVIYQVTSPYTLVGSLFSAQTYLATSSDNLSIYFSLDGTNWGNPIYTQSKIGYDNPQIDLSNYLNNGILPEQYRYYIKFQWTANSAINGAGVENFSLDSQFEEAWEAIPPIHSGTTTITYSDQMNTTHAAGTVQIAYGWIPQSTPNNFSRSTLSADYTNIPANGSTFAKATLLLRTSKGSHVPNMFVQLIPNAGANVQIQRAYKYQSLRGQTDSSGVALFVIRSSQVGKVTLTVVDKNGNSLGIAPLTINFTQPLPAASLTTSEGSTVLNGGFETGDFTDWTMGGTEASTVETSTVYSGTYAAQLGSASVSGTPTDSSIVETLTIPSNANSLNFAFQLVNPNPDPNNYFEVWVRDTASDKLYRLFSTSANGAGWQNQVLTYLQKYRGNTVQLYFNLHQDGSANPAYAYLDSIFMQ